MKYTTFRYFYAVGGLFIFFVLFAVFVKTQNWELFGLKGRDNSYEYSVHGLFLGLIFLFTFNLFISFFAIRSPSSKWYLRLPMIAKNNPHASESKWVQRISLFFFVLAPLFFNIHFQQKFPSGSAWFYPNTTDDRSTRIDVKHFDHFNNYVSLGDALVDSRNHWRYGSNPFEASMTYIPFWQPVLLELLGTITSLSSIFLLSFVFIPTEKHSIGRYIYKKHLNKKFAKHFRKKLKSNELFDFFICHASEDKDRFIFPLKETLEEKGKKVWLDSQAIKYGTSITESINVGLVASRFAIVVLSENFFNKSWTTAELNFIFEMHEKNTDKIIPIWYGVSRSFVEEKEERLADIRAFLFSDEGDLFNLVYEILEATN